MATYLIREENMERLEKNLAKIQKKCKAANCSFTYNVTGEEFKTVEDDNGVEQVYKYKVIETEGIAKYEGWRFVAVLDHRKKGNVIRKYDTELEIPERFKTCGPTCEHCNKIRSRKDTYVIYNEKTNEFKQVGRACLQEYTNGLSAENVAFFCSIYEKIEEAFGYTGTSSVSYINVKNILKYAFECYKHFGYQKSASSLEEVTPGYRSTRNRVVDYYFINRALGEQREILKDETEEVGFNPESEYAVENTTGALEWIRNEISANEYIHNLHVVCSDEYTDYRSLGLLVSLPVAYFRHIDQMAAYEKKQKTQEASKYVSEIGKRIDVVVNNLACIYASENMYGVSYLYKWTDENGNVFTWFASNPIQDTDMVTSIKGTVREHSEYKGIKQTVLTRCKVTC